VNTVPRLVNLFLENAAVICWMPELDFDLSSSIFPIRSVFDAVRPNSSFISLSR